MSTSRLESSSAAAVRNVAHRPPALVLASASPRRRALLFEAGYDFEVHPADIDEDDHPGNLLPALLAEWLAQEKARAMAPKFNDSVILAADTVVAFGDVILGKPADAEHARRMLRTLAGTTHMVVTGIAVRHERKGLSRSARVISAVHMRLLSDEEIERYVASNDWQGKAGGYGIQDDDPFVTRIDGSWTNIVGLPMEQTAEMLAEAEIYPVRAAVKCSAGDRSDR